MQSNFGHGADCSLRVRIQTLALLQYSRRNIIPGLLTMLHMEKALELDNKQDYLHVFDGKSLLRVGANLVS